MKNKTLTELLQEASERGIIEAIGDAITIQDTNYKIIFQNKPHKEIFGDHTGEYCYKAYKNINTICENCHLKDVIEKGRTSTLERSENIPGKDMRYLEITSSPLRNSSGSIAATIEVVRDITERKLAEKLLQGSESRYRSLVESTYDSIYLVDKNYRYIFMNKKHLARLNLLGTQFMERAYSEFHTPKETRIFMEKVDKIFDTGESEQYEYRSPRDGKYFLQTFSPVKDEDGKISAVTVVSKEITNLKNMETKLRTLSFTDELTGLYNRRGFFALAEQQLKLSNREKRGRFLFSADLDNLKKINDTLGHKEGDVVLLETSIILKRSFRDSDIIARIGGDEFVVLVTETSGSNITSLSSRLKANLDKYNSKSNKPYVLSLSYGLTHYDPEDPCTVDELISRADRLMYQDKKNKHIYE
jgi:diguanylate cyclase (GGDEF)-like protein/PAS domain S-box-containing protein